MRSLYGGAVALGEEGTSRPQFWVARSSLRPRDPIQIPSQGIGLAITSRPPRSIPRVTPKSTIPSAKVAVTPRVGVYVDY
jgi:hypothetical protein